MASVEIYIKNYKAQNGNVVSVETLMQTIPMTGDPVITNPKVKTDLGKAGSFEFGLEMNSPYYDSMLQMKTILRVVYFGVTIFRGRVLTIDKSFQRSRTIHCEGDLAFFMDSHQIGQKEESRPETDLFTYLTSVIAQHNSDVADAEKRFTLGEVPMNYSQSVLSDQMVDIPSDKAIQKYGNSSYDTSMDRLESLLSDFGGYMRTRYDSSSGVTYLDWYDNYYNPYVGQDIEVLSNLIDLSGPTEVENLFTVVLPIGKKDNGEVYINEWWPKVRLDHAKVNYITVPELATVPLYSDAELTSGYHRKEDYTNAISRFGKIWKVVEFENANTPQKLFTYAKDWIKNNFMPELTQWDVSALDMRIIDDQKRALYTGDRIKLVHPEVDQNYMYITIISAEYYLYNPDKNKFKIGVPNQQLNASYGVKQKSKGAKSLNNGITDLSSLTNDLEQQINGTLEAIKRDRDILQQQYILKTTYGHDIGLDDPLAFLVYNTDCITEKDPKEISKNTSKIIQTLEWTKKLKFTELVQSAMQKSLETGLPVAWNDLQNVIDNTPDVKQQQAAFKTLATNHLINDLDLPTDEAMDLLNDSSALYEAASMVDDNGNWTQKAIDKGALVWNPALKDVYIHAHEVVNNQGLSIGTGILNHSAGWMTSGSLNVNDYLSLDGLTNQFDLGNIINTQDFTDSLTGVSEKLVSMIGGQFDLSEITNTLTGLKNKAVSALGDLFSGTKIEDTVNNLTNKAVSFVDDLFSGTKIENTLTGVKDKAINFIGGLFSGSSKEKDGSADTDKSVNILSGLITGSDQETESTGEKRSFFDMLGGLFTGGETKESSATEAIKTFFLGNGNAEIDGEHGTANFGDGYEWMVKINDTVDNKDGFVSAKDFQTFQDIPSFKTQFAAIKTLFANHAELISANIQKLTAVEGYINAISSSTIDAEKYVSAGYGSFNNLTVHSSLTADSYTANSFKLKVSDGEGGYENAELGDCFQSAGTKFENGVWTLVLYKIGGGSQEVPFDLTATDWYTNLVAGKTNEGWDNASAIVDIPKTESTNSRIIFISTPYSRTYGNNTTRGTETNTYTLRNWNNNQVCLSWDQGHDGDGTIVSVFEHNQYNNGQNAMTANGSWDPHSPQDTTEEKATNTFRYQAYTTDNPPVAKGTKQYTTVTLSSGMWIGNKKTVYLKEGNTQLAEFEVDASSLVPSGSAPKISTSGWADGVIKLIADASGEDEVDIDLDIDVAADMSGQDKTNHATITVKDGSSSTGETKKLYMTQGTWNESTNKKIVQLRAGSSSAAIVAESEVDASTRYEAGQQSVTVTSAHILANLIDYTARPITGTMSVRLSNMSSTEPNKALTVNLDDVYKSGLNGGDDYSDTADFEFILTDGEDEWSGYFDDIDVSDIYQQGVDDRTPTPTTVTFIYDANGNLVTAYSTAKVMPASSDIYGKLYPNTEINYVKDVTVRSSAITRTYAECTYYGVTFYVLKSSVHTGTEKNSPTKYGKATGWYSGGTVSYDYNGVVSFDSGNSVTIYSKQSTSSSAVTTVQNEVTVKCMYNPNGYAEEWMPVKYGNYTGYLESKYIYGTNAWNALHPTVPVLQNISVEWMAHSTSGYTEDVSMLIDTTKGNAKTVTCQYWPASAYNAITAQSSVDVIEQYLEHVYLNSFLSHVQLSGMPSQINAKIHLRLTYSGTSEDSFINLATTSIGQMVYQYSSTVYADSGSTVNIRSSSTGGGSVVTAVPIGATIYCFDNPIGYPKTSTYMRVKYGQYEGYMMAKFIVGTDAYNDAYGGGDEPSDPTITSREISIVSVAHMSSTTSVSPISTIFNINAPTYTGEGGVTTLVVNSTAIPTSAYNNYGSGYTKLNSIAGYFSSVRHGSGTYSNALEHGVIFTVTTHYSSGSISSKTYVGYITSNPR